MCRRGEKIRLAVALAFVACVLAARAYPAPTGYAGAYSGAGESAADFRPDLPKTIPLNVWQAAVPPDRFSCKNRLSFIIGTSRSSNKS